ncbi:HLH transcription factor, putative [Talaromyces stipitatus ATCC 10500]|uniref:HLH transcription factor, putative n=1 Tax=Talaromyces stipitatus (strain ATCC 10500 / CBS 375.48 / QM 6759 / NRRL 1006) TaxID=441959 RepID=B8MLG6_TALSN|nr:HLH transcription factor, putative [Talaromyces stipitatus ATCC 10500]EED15499.1 HLH transcription factor, putative [Talaromyces stipitatus ATCC 10500]
MHVAGSVNRRASPPPPGPFGYNFLAANDTPYDAGPAPPPGPSLLDDTESNMLESFFTTLNTSQFNVGDAWYQDLSHDKGGGTFGMDWIEGLPPNLEGSTTTLSQSPNLPMHPPKNTNSLMGGPSQDSELLAAASMLWGNGGNTMNFPAQHLFPTNVMSEMAQNHNMSQPRIKQEGMPRHHTNQLDSRHMLPQAQHTPVFNPEQPAVPVDPHTSIEVQQLRWGSDAGFVDQGYQRPAGMENTDEVTKNLLENMKCLEPQTSTTNTRAPTPTRAFEIPHNGNWNNINGSYMSQPSESVNHDEGESSPRPRKRSKIKIQEEDSDDNGTPPRLKKARGVSGGKARRGSSENASKRPKAQQGSKTRENLTEEQKRTNHILSEQKRRNLIKQGFDELCALVPELRGGGFSKSAMLIQAADYLEEVLNGNNILRQQLSQLKAVNGFMIPR